MFARWFVDLFMCQIVKLLTTFFFIFNFVFTNENQNLNWNFENILYPKDYSGNTISEWKWESGLIAQDILNIPDLSYVVKVEILLMYPGNL